MRIICYLHHLFACLRPMCPFSWLGVWFNTGDIWVIERLLRSGRRRRNIYFDFFFYRRVLKTLLHKHCAKVFFLLFCQQLVYFFPDMVKILYWDIQVLKNFQWRWIIQIFGRFWPQLFWDNTFCWIDFGFIIIIWRHYIWAWIFWTNLISLIVYQEYWSTCWRSLIKSNLNVWNMMMVNITQLAANIVENRNLFFPLQGCFSKTFFSVVWIYF